MIILPKRRIWTRQPQYVRRLAPGIPQPHALWIPGLGDITRRYDTLTEADATDSFGRAYQITAAPYSRKTLVANSSFLPTSGGYSVLVLTRQIGAQQNGAFNVGVVGGGPTDRCAIATDGSDGLVLDYGGYIDGSTRVLATGINHTAGAMGCYLATTGPSGMRLYTNGSLVASNSSNPSRGATTSAFAVGDIYDGIATAHNVGAVAIWFEQLPDGLAEKLSGNPWRVFADEKTLIFMPSAGGGASAALTGSATSTATGSLSASIACGITGQSATTSAGTLTPESAVYEAALTGSAATTATGAAAPEINKVLTGSAATTATGAADPAISRALTGSAATTATGALTPDGAISGTGVTTATGALSPALSKAIEGQAATTAVGTLSVTLSSALAGVASVTSAGSLTAQTADIVLSGQQTTTATGALAASLTTTLSGSSATADSGTLTVVQNPLEGLQVATAVGMLAASLSLSLSGRQVTASVGYLDSGAPTFREIVYLKSGIHPSVTLPSPLSG